MQEFRVDPRLTTAEERAGAVITNDVVPNTIVGGSPAEFIKNIPHKE